MKIDFAIIYTVIIASIFAANVNIDKTTPSLSSTSPSKYLEIHSDHIEKRSDNERVSFLETALKGLTDRMLSLVTLKTFNFREFDESAIDFAAEFLDLKLAIKSIVPPRPNLKKKLEFSKRVSSELTQAVLYEKIFKKHKVEKYQLLIDLMQLKLGLLNFLNDRGEIDSSGLIWLFRDQCASNIGTDFRTSLCSFEESLEELKKAFGLFSSVGSVEERFFGDYVEQISGTLEEISAHLSTRDKEQKNLTNYGLRGEQI